MDVFFETKGRRTFCIELGYFDTVLEIKEKVEKYQGIPVKIQTLILNGKVLEDERDIEYCEIFHRSQIQLLVASENRRRHFHHRPPPSSMDVFFESQRGKTFCIELGYFDTVLEIKEKIQKYHGIPITTQTLIFNNQILEDERDIEFCEILHNSHIQLLIASENNNETKPQIKTEENDTVSPPPKKIKLSVKIPSLKTHVPLEMDPDDTVLRLKEKIHEIEPVSVNRIILHSGTGGDLPLLDGRLLRECELVDNSEINVNIKPSPSPAPVPVPVPSPMATGSGSGQGGGGAVGGGGGKKLKLMVQTKCGTKKIPVEMNAAENVGELRKELQKMQQRMQFQLPQEGYFFIYKQNVMDDERSFRWHHVCQGDTIEIFNGSVTGGS
ncbi:polyubiquitin-like [Euphorbia lathyris]|uniref:polyubiquitin-like n=1 Tax=Euphorbia lathyris TaxID=212925 RepID=UPI00331330F7